MRRWWVRQPEYVAHMGEMQNTYKILIGKLEGRDHLGDLGIDGMIILS
jgi:hypothetical protein